MSYSSDEDDDDGDSTFRLQYNGSASSSSSPSPPPHQHNFFAPPFYNRPPTPLPPSPSLTSLLRPSRPTTPDSSDNELQPVPRASPKVPTYEYYGFLVHICSSAAFLTYLLWSYLPSPFLHALGLYYYPNRWWSIAIPSFLVMLLVYIYVALAAYNVGHLTLPMNSIETVVDAAANVVTKDGKGSMASSWAKREPKSTGKHKRNKESTGRKDRKDWRSLWFRGTDAVMDVPLSGVCEVLYGGDVTNGEHVSEEW